MSAARHYIQHFEAKALLALAGLDDPKHRRRDRVVVTGVAVMLVAFGLWAAVTSMPEVAIAPGQVMTDEPVALVQHLEGGLVEIVLVSDGEAVREGQTLLRFASAPAQAELDRLRARDAGLRLREAHLRALRDGTTLDTGLDEKGFSALAADQRMAHEEALRARSDRLAVLSHAAQQRRAEQMALAAQEDGIKRQLTLHGSELALREMLLSQGLTTRIAVLETRRAFLATTAEAERLAAMAIAAARAADEAEARLIEAETATRDDAARELSRVVLERLEAQQAIREAWERVSRLAVLAPVDGIVKGLQVRRAGTVVPPGGPLLEIIPVAGFLVVEARITPREIGFVAPGQAVRVKVHAFDYARFGTVEGTLVQVAASTTLDQQQQPYYAARIALAADHVGRDPVLNRLLPGMTVQADVVTGAKTLLSYLLKPVHAAMNDSFRER
jgi:HlyD family secretion protein/adhesin transport system membrane fusion protein